MSVGVDYYACNYCGDTFPDCGRYTSCNCGERWCSDDCAKEDGHRESIAIDDDGDEVDEMTCNYCRQEDFADYELLGFLIKAHNSSREEVIDRYKEWLTGRRR